MAVSIGLIVRYWRRDEQTARPFGVALVLYGLLFGATITQARAWYVVTDSMHRLDTRRVGYSPWWAVTWYSLTVRELNFAMPTH